MEIVKLSEEDIKIRRGRSVLGIDCVFSGRGEYDVWKSNAQKMFRRGKVREFLRSIYEIYSMEGQFRSNIINRIFKVFISEDIGVGDPYCAVFSRDFLKMDKYTNEDFFDYAYTLCMAKKSRIGDNLIAVVKESKLDIPEDFDECFKLLISTKNYRIVAACLMKLNVNKDITKVKFKHNLLKRKRKRIFEIWDYILDKSKDNVLKCNEALLEIYCMAGEENILNIINAFLNMIMWKDGIETKSLLKCPYTYKEIEEDLTIWPDDDSIDCHTKSGKKLGRNKYFFFEKGARLENIQEKFKDIEKRIYDECLKLYKDK